jgi:FkbH-like protein
MPPPDPLAQRIGDPYTRERAMAREHVLALRAVLGIGRLKCLAVDLDGVLWPGVLAETGAPFAWRPEISGAYSFVGVYFGIHDALKALQRRGILLACVSRNDESVVESLWRYAPNDPVDRLLSPDDFVTRRISWGEKSAAVTDIAVELGVALEAMGFIDDNPVERAEVQEALPSVALFGDDIYRLRHDLLTDPRLSPMRVTREATSRSSTLLARLERERLAQTAVDRDAFISGLEIKLDIRRAERSEELIRVAELFARTTQLNATGVTFTEEVLAMIVKGPPRDMVVALNYRDRFGDQGLVGAAVVQDGEIVNIAMSCRVIGLGVQTAMLRWIIRELRHYLGSLVARIVPTDRNAPVRDVYAQAGFQPGPAGSWRFTLQSVDVADGT